MPKYLRYVTLTGVDETTDFDELVRLTGAYPFVEWGVLYSTAQAGTTPRYPRLDWITEFARKAHDHVLNIALHLCGAVVPKLLAQASSGDYRHPVLELCAQFGRVQLNVNAASRRNIPHAAYRQLIEVLSRTSKCIVQLHAGNASLVDFLLSQEIPRLDILLDESGGRGEETSAWPDLDWETRFRRVGFAGGIGPLNMADKLRGIANLPLTSPFWVDMESRVRNEADQFDLQRCALVLQQAQAFADEQEASAGVLCGVGQTGQPPVPGS